MKIVINNNPKSEPHNYPYITFAIVFINLLVWCITAFLLGNPLWASAKSSELLRFGAIDGATFYSGEWWRLVTSQFLHVHFLHFLFNLFVLIFLGNFLESRIGAILFALVYFISGTIGQMAGVWLTPELVGSGASQTLTGIAGAYMVLLFKKHRHQWKTITFLIIFLFLQIALDLISAHTIKAGHWASFLTGIFIGFLISIRQANQVFDRS